MDIIQQELFIWLQTYSNLIFRTKFIFMPLQTPLRLLVLTNHASHSAENSIYALLREMVQQPLIGQLDIASRNNEHNAAFFHRHNSTELQVYRADADFEFQEGGQQFIESTQTVQLSDYDAIFLRLPHPTPDSFLEFLQDNFDETFIFNRPSAIMWSSGKDFLLKVPELCPPIQLCQTVEEVKSFSEKFPIVLKPLRDYGGQGILRVEGDKIWHGDEQFGWEYYLPKLEATLAKQAYLGMKFMENIGQGDKRIIVINGEIVGASLRKPPKDSWICNASRGGISQRSEAEAEEQTIAKRLTEELLSEGIVMYGFDTLVNSAGKRTLSEVNTLSIGGLKQIGQQRGKTIITRAAKLICDYLETLMEQK